MDRYRQRTIAELLKKTSKLNRPRMTPILEGKDRMQGPLDFTDPDMDFALLQVCGNCRNHLDASVAQNCGICNRGHHSFCLEALSNELEATSVQCCYDCQHQAGLDSNQPGSSSKDSHTKLLEDRMDMCRPIEIVPDCAEPGTSYDVSEHSSMNKKMDLAWNEASPSNRVVDSGSTIFDSFYRPTKTRVARKLSIRRKRVMDGFGLDNSSVQVLPSETDTLMAVQKSSEMDATQIASKVALEEVDLRSAGVEAGSEESKDDGHRESSTADTQINKLRVRSDLEEANGDQLLEVPVVSLKKYSEDPTEDLVAGDNKLVREGNVMGSEKLMGSPKLDVALTVQPVSRSSCMLFEDHFTDALVTSEAPSVEIQEETKVVEPPNSSDSSKNEHFSQKTWSAAPQMVVEQDIDGEKQILIVSQVNFVDQPAKQEGVAHGVAAMAFSVDLPLTQSTADQGIYSSTDHRVAADNTPKKKLCSVLEEQSEDDVSKPLVFVDIKETLPCTQEETIEHLSDGLTNRTEPHKENSGSKAHVDDDSTFTGSETTHAASLSSPNSRVAMEDDIKVCDLCGDAGYEDMLAICNECNGAEHVYCSQDLMTQVPEGYWQCDVCKLKQKAGDFTPSVDVRTVNTLPLRLPSLSRKHSNVGNSRSRLSALLQKRRLPSEKKRAMKGIPSSQFPAKRVLLGVDVPPTKRQAVEASNLPFAPSKVGLIKEASFKIPDTGKVKFVSHTALVGGSSGEGAGLSSRGSVKVSLSGSPSSIPVNSSMVQSGQVSKAHFLSASNSISGPGSAKLNTTSLSNMPSSSTPLANSGMKTSGGLKSSESAPSFLPPSKSVGSKLQLSSKSLKETADNLGPPSLSKEGVLGQSSISNAKVLSKTGSFKPPKVISMGGALEQKLKLDTNSDSVKSSGSRSVPPETGIVKGGNIKYEAKLNSGFPEIRVKAGSATELHLPSEKHNGVDKLIKHELAGSLRATNSPLKDETVLVVSGTSEAQQSSAHGSSVKDVQDLIIEQESSLPFQAASPPLSLARQTSKLLEQVGLDATKEVSKTSMDVIQSAPLLPRPVILIPESSTFKDDENKQLQLATSVDAASEKNMLAAVDKTPTHDDSRSIFTPRSRCFGAWGSPSYVPSLGSTRCYRCKELGHSAKNCNNRSSMPCVSSEGAGAVKAIPPASNADSTCVLKGTVPASIENATRNVQSNSETILNIKPTTEMVPINKPSSTENVQNLNSIVVKVQSWVEEGQVVEDVTPSSSPLVDQVMRNDTPVSKQIADSVLSAPQDNVVGAHHIDNTKEISDGKKEDDNTAVSLVRSMVVSVPSGTQLTSSSAELQSPLSSIPSSTRSGAHMSAAFGPLSGANVKVASPFVSCYQESLKVYPEAQIVWQGAFEVAGKSKPQVSFHGLQANPSNRALPKVREVAKKLQSLLPLEELPRGSEHNSWPVQFQKSPPINDNIALYFFASGKESYVQYYRPLVDRLIKFDLTLKGFIEDAELLIFPSNLLPPGSQCWNNFMFLWAVFRARKLPIKQPNIHSTASEPKEAGNDSGLRLPIQAGVLTWGKVEGMQIDTIANKNNDIPPAEGNKVETLSLPVAENVNMAGPCALFDSDAAICEKPPPCHQQESPHSMQVEAAMNGVQKAQAETIHSQHEKAVVTALPSTQDSIIVKSQPLSHSLLPAEGDLNLNASNNSSIKVEEKADTSVKLVVSSAPKVNLALLRSEHSSIEKAKHSTPLMGIPSALLAYPSLRDRQEDVWTPQKLSSHSPAGQQDKDKGARERAHEKSDRIESGRGVSRDRDREKIRDREKHRERDRDRERSRRHSDWEREKERERGKERERERDRDRDRDRGRDRERERDRERWRDRDERDRRGRDWDRDRDKVGEREKGRERGREREVERERTLARDRSRHRNWDPADAEYGRSGRYWHRYPRSRTPSRSPPGNRDSSPLRPWLDRYHRKYHRSFRHSRSYSRSPDSDHGLARLQPRAESRDLSKDSFAPKGKSPDIMVGDSRAKEESVIKNSAAKDSGGDEQGNYSQRGSNSNSLCGENTSGKERKLPIADLNLSPSEIEGNEEDGNDNDVMMSVEVAMPHTTNQDDHVSGYQEEPGECSISAGKMATYQSADHHMRVDKRTNSMSHSLMNDSSGPSYTPFGVSREGSSSGLQFFPQPMDDDDNKASSIIPDLSLALGAKELSLPQQSELPLFMQLLEPCQESSGLGSLNPSLDVPMISEQADLSLSLAIPEHSKRPVVNTSLRLFG